jgi:nitroreductase
MDVKDAINERRAYRSLDPVEITEEIIEELGKSIQFAPSCFNKQPYRYVFVYEPEVLEKLHGALWNGNEWAKAASMIAAVLSKKDMGCIIEGRDYNLYDTGTATGFMILRATELGLVAHPIAGYDEKRVKDVLGIPGDMQVITLVNIGRRSEKLSPALSDKQIKAERERPERLSLEEVISRNHYNVKG